MELSWRAEILIKRIRISFWREIALGQKKKRRKKKAIDPEIFKVAMRTDCRTERKSRVAYFVSCEDVTLFVLISVWDIRIQGSEWTSHNSCVDRFFQNVFQFKHN